MVLTAVRKEEEERDGKLSIEAVLRPATYGKIGSSHWAGKR